MDLAQPPLEFAPPGPGPWMQDSAHVPDGYSPIMAELYPEHAMRGFAETFARWGALLDGLAWGTVNGFPYHQPLPFDRPGPDGPPAAEFIGTEIERRAAVAAAAFENKIWREDLRLWDDELKPAAVARHRALGDLDLGALDDDALATHLDTCARHLQDMSYQHHRFNGSALVAVADFVLQVSPWVARPPTELFGVLDGYSPVSGVLCPEMVPAVQRLLTDESARALLESSGEPSEVLGALRAEVAEVDEFVRSTGFRVVEGFDVTSPTAFERPETIIGRLRAALDVDPTAATGRADALAASLRAAVPPEHRTAFDELLTEARLMYRLRDERGLYSDISAVGLLRLALLELARRLVAQGRLHNVEHIFEVDSSEARALATGAVTPTADELRDRAEFRRIVRAQGAPRHLGPIPPPPPPVDQLPPPLARVMSAMGFAIEGILGQLEQPAGDNTTIVGICGNGGTYEGKVHLVTTLEDLFDLEPGDVLVARSTGEAFNSMIHLVGAIVTDHGSYASHAAIVAREGGFPAVVGCVDATSRLTQGQHVRVDGDTGQVHVLS
jgi:rifampicin phosphotransferase